MIWLVSGGQRSRSQQAVKVAKASMSTLGHCTSSCSFMLSCCELIHIFINIDTLYITCWCWKCQSYSLITSTSLVAWRPWTDRWSGRSNRGKISVSVKFGTQLDVEKYCSTELVADSYLYSLSAVVMHHGRGFGSGHYTSFCWNDEAGTSSSCLSILTYLYIYVLFTS